MHEEILATFRALRRRHFWTRAVDVFLEAGFVMSLTAASMLLIDRLAFELGWSPTRLSPWTIPVMAGVMILAAILAAAAALTRRASPAALARAADRATGGEERFLSALELAGSGATGGFAPLVMRDAAALPVEPRRIVPRPIVGYRSAIALSLLTAGVLHAFPPQIAPAPSAGFRADPERGAAPLEVTFESLDQGMVDEIRWDFGDGSGESGPNPVHRFEKAGTYTVVQEVIGPGGRARHERSIEVLERDHPVAAFEAEPVKGNAPLSVRFRNRSQNAERFEWDFGDGSKSPDADPQHVYAVPGEYTVRLRASGPNGSDQIERVRYIRVAGKDQPLADFRAHPRKGKAPLQVAFEDLSTGEIASWDWDFGDLTAGQERFSQEVNPTHVYRFPGKYTVKLKVKGPGGEDVEEKVAYIIVESDGSGKGGGGGGGNEGGSGGGGKQGKNKGGGPDEKEGQLYGPRTRERKIGIDPDIVTVDPRGGERVIRDKKVYSKGEGGGQDPKERKVADVFPHYQRTAEETMGRERIPQSVREYVRKYFEEIRPK